MKGNTPFRGCLVPSYSTLQIFAPDKHCAGLCGNSEKKRNNNRQLLDCAWWLKIVVTSLVSSEWTGFKERTLRLREVKWLICYHTAKTYRTKFETRPL